MPIDGLTLGFVARELDRALAGGRIDKITQPDSDLVVIAIRAQGVNHKLLIAAGPAHTRLHLTTQTYDNPAEAPMFCMLLRKHLGGGRVLCVRQLGGDRLVRIDISTLDEMGEAREKQLYFEAMGRHTNLTLVEDGVIIDCARHVTDEMSRVRRMVPGAPFEMPPAQDKLAPEDADAQAIAQALASQAGKLHRALAQGISGLSQLSAREVALRTAGEEEAPLEALPLADISARLAQFFASLPAMGPPVLYVDAQGAARDVFPFAYHTYPAPLQQAQPSLSQALDTLYYEKDRRDRLNQRTSDLRRLLKNAAQRAEKKLALLAEQQREGEQMEQHRIAGELLTAYAHLVPKGAGVAQLPNYYADGQQVDIALDASLSPLANAQRYFKKYRKANVARRLAGEQREAALREVAVIEDALFALEQCERVEEIGEIKAPLRAQGILRPEAPGRGKKREKESLPARYRSPEGLDILVGRNSQQNERLLRLAQPGDVWLHAKDMPGSHVILQTQGQTPPQAALLLAAKAAALHSRGRGAGVAVNYTLRRNVKKPTGAPDGFVIFSGEKTLMIQTTQEELSPWRVQ